MGLCDNYQIVNINYILFISASKLVCFGYKFWCDGTADDYFIWLEPYQGANSRNNKYRDKGLGYSVVMTYVDKLPNFAIRLFFDNLLRFNCLVT